jgi:hypothetical protein
VGNRKGLLDVVRDQQADKAKQDTGVLAEALVEMFAHMAQGHTLCGFIVSGSNPMQYKLMCASTMTTVACDWKRILFIRDLPKSLRDGIKQELMEVPFGDGLTPLAEWEVDLLFGETEA